MAPYGAIYPTSEDRREKASRLRKIFPHFRVSAAYDVSEQAKAHVVRIRFGDKTTQAT